MRRLLYSIALTLAFAGLMALQAQTRHSHNQWNRGNHWGGNISTSTNDDATGDACDDHFNVRFDAEEVFTPEESPTSPPPESAAGLHAHPSAKGAETVVGW